MGAPCPLWGRRSRPHPAGRDRANTGRMYRAQPWFVRRRYAVPYEVFTIREPAVRHYCLLRLAVRTEHPQLDHRESEHLARTVSRAGDLARRSGRGRSRWNDRPGSSPGARAELRRRWRRALRPRKLPAGAWRPADLWIPRDSVLEGGYAPFYLARLPAAIRRNCRFERSALCFEDTLPSAPQ